LPAAAACYNRTSRPSNARQRLDAAFPGLLDALLRAAVTNRHMDTCSRNFAFAWRVAVDLCTQAQ